MKKNIFFVLLLTLDFIACIKPKPVDPATKIEGQLLERGTETPIPNTKVKLIEVTSHFPDNPTMVTINSVITDDKGQYSFDFQWTDPLKTYELGVVSNDLAKYYSQPKVVGNIKRGQLNKTDCFMYAYGWVKYRVKNINPYDDRDTIWCRIGMLTGKNIDKTVVLKELKSWEKPDSIGWIVTKNKIQTSCVKPIALVPHDTIPYEINY